PNLVIPDKIPANDQITALIDGFRAYPLPGSILLYEEGDEFNTIPDGETAEQFVVALVLRIVALVENAFYALRENL
ncbi:MAG: hypothetical protein ACXACI_03930, partial [Candidatus Hodarchaeales archaeon]